MIRYCEGTMPKKEYSDQLKRLQNSYNMLRVFEASTEVLTVTAPKKLKTSIIHIMKGNFHDKLYGVIHYFLVNIDVESGEAITPLKLQKLVYYVKAWFLGMTGKNIFVQPVEAWTGCA